MNGKERILTENYDEYFELAEKALKTKKYNSSATLFFKAIIAATDIFLLKKEGTTPSSHTNRFRLLQEKYSKLYEILDKDFPFYQDSYTKKMNKEAVEVLREDAKRIKEMSKK
jgi:uncharacterized protein (UPF0332 family)